jgi:transcriptional regulator with XRE-family HTH domain
MTNKAVGKRIKDARLETGFKQADLAYRVGVSTQLISAFESGRIRPAKNYLEKIAQHTHKPLYFFTGQRVSEALSRVNSMIKELEEIRAILAEAIEGED